MKRLFVLLALFGLIGGSLQWRESRRMPGLMPLALEFWGPDSPGYIDYGFLPSVFSDRTPNTISVSLWIKPRSLITVHYMLSFSSDNGGLSFAVDENLSGERRLYVVNSIYVDGGTWQTNNIAANLNIGQWNHVAFTYDMSSGANDPVIYLNGESLAVVETDAPSSASSYNKTCPLIVGNITTVSKPPDTNGFDGQIFDVRIYNTILTQANVTAIYNGGAPSMSAGPHDITSNSGLIFHCCAVRTEKYSQFVDKNINGLKLFDAQLLAVGTVTGNVTGRASP